MFDRLFSGAGDGRGEPRDAESLRGEAEHSRLREGRAGGRRSEVVPRGSPEDSASHLAATREIERHLQEPAKVCGGVTRPDGTLDLGPTTTTQDHPHRETSWWSRR
jgi:hypothetical protein